ncbi:MAG TPA: ATP-binding protein [Isosphaeraceae bacterium]
MSLSARLTGFFLVAVAILLVGASTATYLLARAHLHHDLDERIINTLDLLAAEAVDRPGLVAWRPGSSRPQVDGNHGDEAPVRWAVFDGTGRLREKHWDLGPDDLAAILDLVPAEGHSHVSYEGRDGRRWRLALRRLRALPRLSNAEREEDDEEAPPSRVEFAPGPASSSLFLAAGGPLEPVEATLRNVGLSLIGLSTGLLLLAAIAGRHYCRWALRPVAAMADAARAMSGWERYYHLPSPGTGDELEGLAQSFNDLLDRLHHELERQTRFTGDASHQLRTPLTALIGELEVARRRDRSAEDYRQIIDEAHGEALRLREIIESLLFLARAEAEASCPDLRPIDLASWLPGHLRGWSARDRGHDIETDIADAPLRIRAHEPLLGQLLDNLLENAAKYSEPGTPILVGLRRIGDEVELSVADRGVGLGADELPHVFEPFYRSPRARLRGRPGVGLGLAVVRRIAANFSGTVSAEGTPGLGSRFVVRFPEAVRAEVPSLAPAS